EPAHLLVITGLHDVGTSAQHVRSLDVVRIAGRGEDQRGNDRQFGCALQVLQYGEAVAVRHLEIGDDKRRIRKTLTIAIISVSFEISNGIFTTARPMNGASDTVFAKRPRDEQLVVFAVVNGENSELFVLHF